MKNYHLALVSVLVALFASCTKPAPAPTPTPEPDPDPQKVVALTSFFNLTPDFVAVKLDGQLPEDWKGELMPGSKKTFTITPGEILSSGFSPVHAEHIFVHVGDKVIKPVFPTGQSSASTLTVDVEIPAADFDMVLCYSVQQQLKPDGHTMTLEPNSDGVKLYGVDPSEKYKYFDCYLLAPDAYTVSSVEFKVGNGQWQDINSVTGCSFVRSELVDRVFKVTVRPDYKDVTGDVTIRAKGGQHARHTITYMNADAKYLDLTRSELPSESIDGETVVATLYINDPWYLASVGSSAPGHSVEIIAGCYLRLVMPATDLTITLNFLEQTKLVANKGAHITEASFYDQPDIFAGVPTNIAVPGSNIYLLVTAEKGYKPTTVTYPGGSVVPAHYGMDMYFATIPVPAERLESMAVTAEADVAHTVTPGANVFLSDGDIYCKGETVRFTIQVPAGKQVSEVKVTSPAGEGISCQFTSPYGSFVMPDSDVTVTAIFEDLGGDFVTVTADFDDESFHVYSSTDYDWNFAQGFTLTKGATFYLQVMEYYGEMFYVGVKVGDNVSIFDAHMDGDTGEYDFGRAIVADGNVSIKVAYSRSDVQF